MPEHDYKVLKTVQDRHYANLDFVAIDPTNPLLLVWHCWKRLLVLAVSGHTLRGTF